MEDFKQYSETKCINKLLNCCHSLRKQRIPDNLRNQIDTIINILGISQIPLRNSCYIYLKWFIDDIHDKTTDYIYYIKTNRKSLDTEILWKHAQGLSTHFFNIIDKQMNDGNTTEEIYYNTNKFYEDELANLKNELEDKKRQLQENEVKQDLKESELKTLRKTIDELSDKITTLKKEQEELRKQDDKKTKLQDQINNVFINLEKYTQPITDEQQRLLSLYETYKIAIFLLFIILIWYEFHTINRWRSLLVKDFISYIPFYLPIPLFGTLLGVCIYQMNRAQRQLLLIAQQLHHITYIEGLLSALSSLSMDITEGANKVRSVIEQLINNYLKQNLESIDSKIDLALEKDNVYDLDKTLNYLHKLKELFNSKT